MQKHREHKYERLMQFNAHIWAIAAIFRHLSNSQEHHE